MPSCHCFLIAAIWLKTASPLIFGSTRGGCAGGTGDAAPAVVGAAFSASPTADCAIRGGCDAVSGDAERSAVPAGFAAALTTTTDVVTESAR